MPAAPPRRDANRVVRAALLPLASLALTWSAHTAAGGHPGDLVAVAVPLLLISTAGTMLADRVRNRLSIGVALAGTQFGSHLFLSLTGAHHGGSDESLRMLAAHVIAAMAFAVLLAHAESLLDAAQRLLPRRRGRFQPARSTGPTALPADEPDPVFLTVLRHSCTRRGPPGWPALAIP